MMMPNPAPRSNPDPKAVILDIDDPTTKLGGLSTFEFSWTLLTRKREEQGQHPKRKGRCTQESSHDDQRR